MPENTKSQKTQTYSRDQDVRLLEDALAAGKDVCARVSEGPYSNEWLDALAALDRIVAGSRSLEEQLQSVEAERTYFSEQTDAMFAQKVDAEAERSQLRDDFAALVEQLEATQAALAAFFAEWDGAVGTYAPTDDTLALMRAASIQPPRPRHERAGTMPEKTTTHWRYDLPDGDLEGLDLLRAIVNDRGLYEGRVVLDELIEQVEALRNVAAAASVFESTFQRSLGSASVYDIELRNEAQAKLRMALNVWDASSPAKSLCDMTHPGEPCPATGYRDEDSGVWIDKPGPHARRPSNPASEPEDDNASQ